jgi:large subunit ribosomal protein L22
MTGLIAGKPVPKALVALSFANKRGAAPLKKLLLSAIANAKALGANPEELVVSAARVDGGVVLKRFMPRARGSAFRIKKRTSNVTIVLDKARTPQDKKSRSHKTNKSKS